MPFNIFKKTVDDTNYKGRLERKMCIAKETPEPIFDISSCNLKSVPSGVYSLCRVFRKDTLCLHDNQLTSLEGGGLLNDLSYLKVLDVHANKLTSLPESIGLLTHLEIFNCSENQLSRLPNSFGNLVKLQSLKLSNNKLEFLPNNMGNCKRLVELDLRQNVRLKILPQSFGKLRKLKTLMFDQSFTYPPLEIFEKGIESILEFLTEGADDDLSEPSDHEENPLQTLNSDFKSIEEKFLKYERMREEQQKQRIEFQKEQTLINTQEKLIQQEALKTREKLVEQIKELDLRVENAVLKFQELRDNEKVFLVNKCLQDEKEANLRIKSLLDNLINCKRDMILKTEQDEKFEEELLNDIYRNTRTLEKDKIMESIKRLIEEEERSCDRYEKYKGIRAEAINSWIANETVLSEKLGDKLKELNADKSELCETLGKDEELQKAAVAAMLEKSDMRSWQLSHEVAAVQRQLFALTQLELTKKRVAAERHLDDLCYRRVELTELLMNLFEQQQERRQLLADRLRLLESIRDCDNFWLGQYQGLLESNSSKMVEIFKQLDPQLLDQLLIFGVLHYLPVISSHITDEEKIKALSKSILESCGVSRWEDQNAILEACEVYLKNYCKESLVASAPPEELEPSAPPLLSPTTSQSSFSQLITSRRADECVLCLEHSPDLLFIPCGHICCCLKCGPLTNCPLCREGIIGTVQVSI